jgi:hypothetical protein
LRVVWATMLSGPKEAAGESDIRPASPSSMVMSLATMLLAFTTHVIVQEAERNAAILLDYLLDLLELLSLAALLASTAFQKRVLASRMN